VKRFTFAGPGPIPVEKYQVGREAFFVHHPTMNSVGIVDVVVLLLSWPGVPKPASRNDVEDSVRGLHQGLV